VILLGTAAEFRRKRARERLGHVCFFVFLLCAVSLGALTAAEYVARDG
jgi:hypothetical protein